MLVAFKHAVLGFIPDDVRAGMDKGWSTMHARGGEKAQAQAGRASGSPQGSSHPSLS
ncbi:MAG: hypothetical protein JSS95_08000 [Acidobacteria bacterium]|nr:hypothetical protein [Acidobacteriota bacterium]